MVSSTTTDAPMTANEARDARAAARENKKIEALVAFENAGLEAMANKKMRKNLPCLLVIVGLMAIAAYLVLGFSTPPTTDVTTTVHRAEEKVVIKTTPSSDVAEYIDDLLKVWHFSPASDDTASDLSEESTSVNQKVPETPTTSYLETTDQSRDMMARTTYYKLLCCVTSAASTLAMGALSFSDVPMKIEF